jgi:membrane-associated phospholipid phosphatase
MITGAGIYAGGLIAGSRRAEDLGLHTVETIVIANTITAAIKMTAGRARPRESPNNAANFQLFRGFGNGEYQSFPSGHTTAAFAFATIVSAETSHWWPESRWIVGPVVYGGAALTGVSRIYNNAHWASDVIAGAAVGTLTGIKVYRYQHSHPNNRLDKRFLRAGVQVSNSGSIAPIMSMVSR